MSKIRLRCCERINITNPILMSPVLMRQWKKQQNLILMVKHGAWKTLHCFSASVVCLGVNESVNEMTGMMTIKHHSDEDDLEGEDKSCQYQLLKLEGAACFASADQCMSLWTLDFTEYLSLFIRSRPFLEVYRFIYILNHNKTKMNHESDSHFLLS